MTQLVAPPRPYYPRQPHDLYRSDPWVIEPLLKHVDVGRWVWEPACGEMDLVNALRAHGKTVFATDIQTGDDFLQAGVYNAGKHWDSIVSNFPYSRPLVDQMLAHALQIMRQCRGERRIVALLFYSTFDNAKE